MSAAVALAPIVTICTCCSSEYTAAAWSMLPCIGIQRTFRGGGLELRNCGCGSSRAVCAECGRSGCSCPRCGALCSEPHESDCDDADHDLLEPLRRISG